MNFEELLKKESNEIRKIIKEEKTHIIEKNMKRGTPALIQRELCVFNAQLRAEGLR